MPRYDNNPIRPSKPEKLNTRWITGVEKIDDNTIDWASSAGLYLAQGKERKKDNLSTSSIRRFFGDLKRIQQDFPNHREDVPFLRARLAYDAKRKPPVEPLYNMIKDGIIAINDKEENFLRFLKIFEAIVAFHKYHGGDDK